MPSRSLADPRCQCFSIPFLGVGGEYGTRRAWAQTALAIADAVHEPLGRSRWFRYRRKALVDGRTLLGTSRRFKPAGALHCPGRTRSGTRAVAVAVAVSLVRLPGLAWRGVAWRAARLKTRGVHSPDGTRRLRAANAGLPGQWSARWRDCLACSCCSPADPWDCTAPAGHGGSRPQTPASPGCGWCDCLAWRAARL